MSNKYIMKRINIIGTEVQLLEAIRDLLVNNEAMKFSVVEENLANEDNKKNSIILENDDYMLKICGDTTTNDTTNTSIEWNLYSNTDEAKPCIATFTITTHSSSAIPRIHSVTRIINIFMVKGDDIDFINVARYDATFGKNNSPFYIRMATSDVGLVQQIGSSSSSHDVIDYETRTLRYKLDPYHTIAKSDDTLILDRELPLRNITTDIEYYCGIVKGCFGLGGGVARTFYKDSHETLIFCFANNCCFKLEENMGT